MRIAVAGGAGTVGHYIVEQATTAGHDVVVLSRSNGVDLVTGDGARAAIDGADAVIDVASIQTLSATASRKFFGTVTEKLLAAARGADVHHVALSIVGAAQAPAGYYAGKLLQEQLVAASAGHWSILRATQFHEFAVQVLAQAKILGAHLVPRMRSQPVAASEVAAALSQARVRSGWLTSPAATCARRDRRRGCSRCVFPVRWVRRWRMVDCCLGPTRASGRRRSPTGLLSTVAPGTDD